jgi:hypothetical protein
MSESGSNPRRKLELQMQEQPQEQAVMQNTTVASINEHQEVVDHQPQAYPLPTSNQEPPRFTLHRHQEPQYDKPSDCYYPTFLSCAVGSVCLPPSGLCLLIGFKGPYERVGVFLGTAIPFAVVGVVCLAIGTAKKKPVLQLVITGSVFVALSLAMLLFSYITYNMAKEITEKKKYSGTKF